MEGREEVGKWLDRGGEGKGKEDRKEEGGDGYMYVIAEVKACGLGTVDPRLRAEVVLDASGACRPLPHHRSQPVVGQRTGRLHRLRTADTQLQTRRRLQRQQGIVDRYKHIIIIVIFRPIRTFGFCSAGLFFLEIYSRLGRPLPIGLQKNFGFCW